MNTDDENYDFTDDELTSEEIKEEIKFQRILSSATDLSPLRLKEDVNL